MTKNMSRDQTYLPTLNKTTSSDKTHIHATTKKASHYKKDPATIAKNPTPDKTNSPSTTNTIT